MKCIDGAAAQARLPEILDEVEHQPIVIRRQGADSCTSKEGK
jgi:PHD/YefM family antitoxin component YafN of YafNO toxin-antitoxin module